MQIGKFLLLAGLGLAALGAAAMLASQAGIKLFRLPGDIVWKGKNTTVYVPIATSILLSVVLTLLLALFRSR